MGTKSKSTGDAHARKVSKSVERSHVSPTKDTNEWSDHYQKPRRQFEEWASFSFCEKWFYIVAWICSCGYAIYRTWLVSYENVQDMSPYSFTGGWFMSAPWRDGSNFEWEFWRRQFPSIFPIMAGHVVLGQLMRLISFEHRGYAFMAYGMMAFWYLTNIWSLSMLIGHCLVAYVVAWSGSHLLTWISVVLLVGTFTNDECAKWTAWLCGTEQFTSSYYLVVFIIGMCNLRYASFCSEWCMVRAEATKKNKSVTGGKDHGSSETAATPSATNLSFSFIDLLIYVFYIPFHFYGPMVNYKDFYVQIYAPLRPHTPAFLLNLLLDFLRVCFWIIFCEVLLHFVYFNAIAHEQPLLLTISRWALVGSGSLLCQFFQAKYVIFWGLPGVLARLDQFDPPPWPRCVATIHIYSNMWKYFDHGLYLFLTRHIYIPLGGSKHGILRQILASCCCFAFVGFWHGGKKYLIYWVTLTFIGVSLETLGAVIYCLPAVTRWRQAWLSGQMQRRIFAGFATPVLIMNTLACFVFHGGLEFGFVAYQRAIFEDWPVSALWAYGCAYCWVQTGIEVDQWQRRRKLKVD